MLEFIKHKNYRDICWRVLAKYAGTGYIKYKVECWNMGFEHSWPMSIKDYIDIPNDDTNWLRYSFEMKNVCLRHAKWEELNANSKTL